MVLFKTMKEIPQFETSDLNTTMAWYLTGKVTMRQLCDELNAQLRAKVEQERELDEQSGHAPRRPSCF